MVQVTFRTFLNSLWGRQWCAMVKRERVEERERESDGGTRRAMQVKARKVKREIHIKRLGKRKRSRIEEKECFEMENDS